MKKCTIEIEDDDFKKKQDGSIVKTKIDGVAVVIVSADKFFEQATKAKKEAAEEAKAEAKEEATAEKEEKRE